MKVKLRRETLVLLGFLLLALIGMALPGRAMREGLDGDKAEEAPIHVGAEGFAEEAGRPQPAAGEKGGTGRLNLEDLDRRMRRLEAQSGSSSKSFT